MACEIFKTTVLRQFSRLFPKLLQNCGAVAGVVFKCIHSLARGWRLRTGPICCWQATRAVYQHKDTAASPDKNCHRHLRVCCFCCCL